MRPLVHLRLVAILEGVSFVVLLFVAMPLKYVAAMPLPVRIVGGIHGGLFVLFVAALLRAAFVARWSIGRATLAFLSSLMPFGTFVFDRSLQREIARTAIAPAAPAA